MAFWGLYVPGTEPFFSYAFFDLAGNSKIHQKSSSIPGSDIDFGETSVFSYEESGADYHQVASCFKIDKIFYIHIF